MAAKKRIVIAGAGGVFGSLLCRELEADYDVVATTRATLDLRNPEAVANAARGAWAFACAAGPFRLLDRRIVRAVVDAGSHWLDIADDAEWFFDLIDDRRLRAAAEDRGVAVLPGLSTLPAISGALVRRLGAPPRVEIALRIGNRNAKGAAAIASGAALRSPDRELFWREMHVESTVRTEFEVPGVAAAMRLLSALPLQARWRLAKIVAPLVTRLRFGSPGGSISVRSSAASIELAGPDQRLAILPLVYALAHMPGAGVHSPLVFDHEALLQWIEAHLR